MINLTNKASLEENMMDLYSDYKMIIDGERVAGDAEIDIFNPATGEVFAKAPDLSLIHI